MRTVNLRGRGEWSATFIPNIANLYFKMLHKLGKVCTFLAKDFYIYSKYSQSLLQNVAQTVKVCTFFAKDLVMSFFFTNFAPDNDKPMYNR